MKKTAILIVLSLAVAGCNNSAQTATDAPPPATQQSNANLTAQRTGNMMTVSSHSEKSPTPASAPRAANSAVPSSSSSSAGNSPMAKGIDVTEMTAAIEKAEKAYKAKADDEKAKNALAEAYFVRAFALTEAAQYRAALGDFRKGLKLNAEAPEARKMHDQIISIFQSINRDPPKEGEEPAPIPFKKTS
jgi:tetratricopeptide (TPR) repeat protein